MIGSNTMESVMNEAPRKLRGRIVQVKPAHHKNFYGVIQAENRTKYFFHSDDVLAEHKAQIRPGAPVAFDLGVKVEKGKFDRAANVEVLQLQAAA